MARMLCSFPWYNVKDLTVCWLSVMTDKYIQMLGCVNFGHLFVVHILHLQRFSAELPISPIYSIAEMQKYAENN